MSVFRFLFPCIDIQNFTNCNSRICKKTRFVSFMNAKQHRGVKVKHSWPANILEMADDMEVIDNSTKLGLA